MLTQSPCERKGKKLQLEKARDLSMSENMRILFEGIFPPHEDGNALHKQSICRRRMDRSGYTGCHIKLQSNVQNIYLQGKKETIFFEF